MNADFEDADLVRVCEAREAGDSVWSPAPRKLRYRTH